MTASVANGFGHILYQPESDVCHMEPYAFHPEYSTGNPRGNTWSAHTYNVAYLRRDRAFRELPRARRRLQLRGVRRRRAGRHAGRRRRFCVPARIRCSSKINGCFLDERTSTARPISNDWPGTDPNRGQDAKYHPTPVMFTSPLTNGTTNYSKSCSKRTSRGSGGRLAAQPTVLRPDDRPGLRQSTGRRQFYPFYSPRMDNGICRWQEGGPYIPGTTKTSAAIRPRQTGRSSRRRTRPGNRIV